MTGPTLALDFETIKSKYRPQGLTNLLERMDQFDGPGLIIDSLIHYPHTVRFFFEDRMTYPYLFTFQMRLLLSRLHQLSQQYRYNFTKWWLLASKFNLPLDREPLMRTVIFDDQEIRIEGLNPSIEEMVQLPPDYQLKFRFVDGV